MRRVDELKAARRGAMAGMASSAREDRILKSLSSLQNNGDGH